MGGKRTLLVIVAIAVTCCVLVGWLQGYEAMWSFWKFPTLLPHFGDVRNLTGGAESIAMGYDPLYFNPQDPWGRPLNQPRFVQAILSVLNLHQGQTTMIGILFIFLFFLGIFIALKPINHLTAVMLALVICSPAVVLGIERGNHDLLVFFLVAIALGASNIPVLSMVILLLAALIKLFPVFALSYFFKYEKKTQLLVFSGFIVSFLLYILANYADWSQVFNATQKGYGIFAYGVQTYSLAANADSYVPLLAMTVSILTFYLNTIAARGARQGDSTYIDAFRAGAGIYVGTFFLGNIWVYRLMFLIFAIPQLMVWRKDARRSAIAFMALVSLMISCWSMWGQGMIASYWLNLIDETGNWILFATLFYLLLSSMPLVIQKYLVRTVLLVNSGNEWVGQRWLRIKTLGRR